MKDLKHNLKRSNLETTLKNNKFFFLQTQLQTPKSNMLKITKKMYKNSNLLQKLIPNTPIGNFFAVFFPNEQQLHYNLIHTNSSEISIYVIKTKKCFYAVKTKHYKKNFLSFNTILNKLQNLILAPITLGFIKNLKKES